MVAFLESTEVDAVAGGAGSSAVWPPRSCADAAVQTGLRLSELIGLRRDDVHLGMSAHVRDARQGTQGAMYADEQNHAGGDDGMAA